MDRRPRNRRGRRGILQSPPVQADAVGRRPVVAVVVTVLRPLPDIAYHVIKTEPVGGE